MEQNLTALQGIVMKFEQVQRDLARGSESKDRSAGTSQQKQTPLDLTMVPRSHIFKLEPLSVILPRDELAHGVQRLEHVDVDIAMFPLEGLHNMHLQVEEIHDGDRVIIGCHHELQEIYKQLEEENAQKEKEIYSTHEQQRRLAQTVASVCAEIPEGDK